MHKQAHIAFLLIKTEECHLTGQPCIQRQIIQAACPISRSGHQTPAVECGKSLIHVIMKLHSTGRVFGHFFRDETSIGVGGSVMHVNGGWLRA